MLLPRAEDSIRDYPSAGLTPSRLVAILREADGGSLSAAMQLYEEMEEKDPHLYSVANTRRMALTGLEWQIVSAADVHERSDRGMADAAADHCRNTLSSLDSLDEALEHLSLAVGRNISVVEIVWDAVDGAMAPVDLVPVDFTRLTFDDLDRLRILTVEEPRDGIEPPSHKFIMHAPHAVSGHVARGGLLRVTAMAYLAKNLALKDWMVYAELFGMPVRIARYEPQATAEEKRELLTMLDALGSRAAGVFSKAVELQFVEAGRGTTGPPYLALLEFLNREISKAWLGQTLTTDVVSQSGTLAASQVHEKVRKDLLADDVGKEGRTIRRDLLAPLTRMRFGPDAPVPYFRRRIEDPPNVAELAGVLSVAVNELGVRVPARWAHAALHIPEAGEGGVVLPGRSGGSEARDATPPA
jgi:phage gp29-like protein